MLTPEWHQSNHTALESTPSRGQPADPSSERTSAESTARALAYLRNQPPTPIADRAQAAKCRAIAVITVDLDVLTLSRCRPYALTAQIKLLMFNPNRLGCHYDCAITSAKSTHEKNKEGR